MNRLRALVSLCSATALVAAATATTTGAASADPIVLPDLIDDEVLSCTQLVPHALSLDNTPVTLDVRVLLDGVGLAEAQDAFATVATSYAPLAITVAPTYAAVSFTGNDAAGLNQQAKDLYGGARPEGVDVVYTMTSKDITAAGSPLGDNVAGLADCIGGVRFDDHAFAVGETFPDPVTGGTIPLPVRDATAKTAAHEIGHLMGAHHHYSSPEGLLSGGILTLMGPTLSVISLRFSTLNSLMVKGHAQLYATP